jgi:hypothetical protein
VHLSYLSSGAGEGVNDLAGSFFLCVESIKRSCKTVANSSGAGRGRMRNLLAQLSHLAGSRLTFAVTFELLEHLIAFLGIEQNGSPDNDRR